MKTIDFSRKLVMCMTAGVIAAVLALSGCNGNTEDYAKEIEEELRRERQERKSKRRERRRKP